MKEEIDADGDEDEKENTSDDRAQSALQCKMTRRTKVRMNKARTLEK